jgi:hypothetical protein
LIDLRGIDMIGGPDPVGDDKKGRPHTVSPQQLERDMVIAVVPVIECDDHRFGRQNIAALPTFEIFMQGYGLKSMSVEKYQLIFEILGANNRIAGGQALFFIGQIIGFQVVVQQNGNTGSHQRSSLSSRMIFSAAPNGSHRR